MRPHVHNGADSRPCLNEWAAASLSMRTSQRVAHANRTRGSLLQAATNGPLSRTRRSRRHHSCVPSEEARRSSWVEPRCRVVFRRCCTPRARRFQPPRQLERDPRFHSKRDAPSSPRVRPRVVYSGCWPVRNATPGGPTNQRPSSCQRVQAGPIDHAARPSGQNGLGGVLSRGGAGLHPVLGPLQKRPT